MMIEMAPNCATATQVISKNALKHLKTIQFAKCKNYKNVLNIFVSQRHGIVLPRHTYSGRVHQKALIHWKWCVRVEIFSL